MIHPKNNPLLSAITIAIIGFLFAGSDLVVAEQTDVIVDSKIEQSESSPVKLQEKVWYGNINANQTKQLELNLLFPDEGKFFIEIIGAAYDRSWKFWKILGEYFVYVTTKKGEAGKIEKTTTRPKVTPYKIKMEGPVTVNPWELSHNDTMKAKSSDLEHKVPPNPPSTWRLHQSRQAGEAPIELIISFEPNPKINEPTKLLVNVSSTVPRDSVYIDLILPDSIKVIK